MSEDTSEPDLVQHLLRAAFCKCWLTLPDGGKNVAKLEREMKWLLDVTVENLQANPQAFGIGGGRADAAASEVRDERFQDGAALPILHQATEACHKLLPVERRGAESVEREIRIQFQRSLDDLRAKPPGFIRWP
jgi:hypothetical protein